MGEDDDNRVSSKGIARDGDDSRLTSAVFRSTTDQRDDGSMVIGTKQMDQNVQPGSKFPTKTGCKKQAQQMREGGGSGVGWGVGWGAGQGLRPS